MTEGTDLRVVALPERHLQLSWFRADRGWVVTKIAGPGRCRVPGRCVPAPGLAEAQPLTAPSRARAGGRSSGGFRMSQAEVLALGAVIEGEPGA